MAKGKRKKRKTNIPVSDACGGDVVNSGDRVNGGANALEVVLGAWGDFVNVVHNHSACGECPVHGEADCGLHQLLLVVDAQ